MEEGREIPEVRVSLPNCDKRVVLPKEWTQIPDSRPLTLTGPEENLRVVLLVVSGTANPAEIASCAWRQTDSGFNYPILHQAETPSTEGWDRVAQLVYNIPAAESRTAFAAIRILDELAYVALIDGSKGALSRRMAQISEILEAWRPSGLKAVNLGLARRLCGARSRVSN